MGDLGIEYDENDLFNAWIKHARRRPKLHAKACHDKCGCYKPKNLER